jgi:hypothetical protein
MASRRSRQTMRSPPGMKMFSPISWYEGASVSECISHLIQELGRLGLSTHDIESHDRPPHTRSVLSDLLGWLGSPNECLAKLMDWQRLDLSAMRSRLTVDPHARPRIEVSAHITKMNNLSVRWHPAGYRHTYTYIDLSVNHESSPNLIENRKWQHPPDFRWFTGDEEPTFDSRASNELMFLRGVGNLKPSPSEAYGPYATYNRDVVDSILICAVRAAYEGLIRQLELSFQVAVVDAFDFEIRKEADQRSGLSGSSIERVVSWSLEDAAELKLSQEREAQAKREAQERSELANVRSTYGFEIDVLIEAVHRASKKKDTGPAPTGEHANRNAAKELRAAGFRIDAGQVRRLRQLVERYAAEKLPEGLRPSPPAEPSTPPSNVVRFPEIKN